MNVSKNLTQGNVAKVLPLFAFPYLLANLLQAALGIADMGITAMYCGEGGAAAIGVASQIVYLVVNAATGLASGATILIGQRYGAEDREGVRKAVATLTSISLMVAVPTAIGVGVGAKGLLGVLQTPPEAMEGAKAYLIVSMAGLPFVFAYNGLSAVIRGLGNSKIPLMIIGGAAILNIGLDFVTVGLLKWGVGGAAAATVLAEALSAAVALGFLVRKTPFRLGDFKPAWDKASAKEIVKIGFPTAVQNATASLSFLLLTVIVNRLQVASVLTVAAAHAMATKFNNFAVLAPRGMSQAMAAIVAQNVGAKKFRRNRSVLLWGVIYSVAFGAVFVLVALFAGGAIFRMLGADGETLAAGIGYLKRISADYILLPLAVCPFGILDGYGKTSLTMTINLIGSLGVRVPFAYLIGIVKGTGLAGIGWSIPLASLFCAICAWIAVVVVLQRSIKKATRQSTSLSVNTES